MGHDLPHNATHVPLKAGLWFAFASPCGCEVVSAGAEGPAALATSLASACLLGPPEVPDS